MKSFLFKYRLIFFGLSILLLTMLAFYANQPNVSPRPATVRHEGADSLESYTALEPLSIFLDTALGFDLTTDVIFFSNDGELIFTKGEDGGKFITRYKLKGENIDSIYKYYLKGFNRDFMYVISMVKDQLSGNIMTVYFPISREEDTKHWVYDSFNAIDVLIYNRDFKVINRRKVKLRCSEPILPENLPAGFEEGGYVLRNDTIFLIDGSDNIYRLAKGVFDESPFENETLKWSVSNKRWVVDELNSGGNEVEIFVPASGNVFRYKLKTPSRHIYVIDSGFISVTGSGSFERYRLPF